MSLRFTGAAAAALAFAFACGGAQSGGAERAELDAAQVTALEIGAVGGATAFCPGGPPLQLRAVVTTADGGKLETWAAGEPEEGKLGFDRFEWSASPGQVDALGRLAAPPDPFTLLDRPVTVTARVVGRSDLEAKLELPPNWKCGGVANVSGQAGGDGGPGAAGVPGRAGRPGTANTRAEHGELGERGQDGSVGGQGQPGHAVDVALAWVTTPKHGRLVLVRVGERSFLFDPTGEKFAVASTGGAGGKGGPGGAGGQGGEGGDTNADQGAAGNGSDGGPGGNGGKGGDGGDGGALRVQFDGRHPELVQAVRFESLGGPGGKGGAGGAGGRGGQGGISPTGMRGTAGRTGQTGQAGATGRTGQNGPPVDARPADVRQLFAEELGRGVPIAVEGG
jgi:hypothetical protein